MKRINDSVWKLDTGELTTMMKVEIMWELLMQDADPIESIIYNSDEDTAHVHFISGKVVSIYRPNIEVGK